MRIAGAVAARAFDAYSRRRAPARAPACRAGRNPAAPSGSMPRPSSRTVSAMPSPPLPLACGFAEIDVDVLCLGVADDVGQAFLHAAIDREIDRVAIAAHRACRPKTRMRSAGCCRARSRTSSERMSCSGTWPSAIGRSRLSMLRLMLCRCSMIASMSPRALGHVARRPARAASPAAVAIEPALALRPNRLGPTSSCSSSAVRRRSSSCAVISRWLSCTFSAARGVERLRQAR